MMRGVLRGLAVVIAVAAAIDPAVRAARPAPVAVALRTADGALVPAPGAATSLRRRLEEAMPGAVAFNTAAGPGAVIVEGAALAPALIPEQGPLFVVSPALPTGPRVRVVSVAGARPVLPGWSAAVTAEVEGRDVAPGSSSTIVLEHHGVEVDRQVHRWSKPGEQFTARLTFVPPAAGSFALTTRVLPIDGGTQGGAVGPAVQVLAEQRRLRVVAFDPRPSWGSGFVRRALEADSSFDVATRIRASRGPEVRTGAPPIVLTDASLDPFNLALIGAPEDLSAGELTALERFASIRGGTVVFLADRKSSGGYLRLLGVPSLEETLLEKPIKVQAADGSTLRGSEFAHPAVVPIGAEIVADIPHGAGRRSPLVAVPAGRGLLMFSGLLDAWRYRAEDEGAFDAFWRSHLAAAAARAPRRLELTLTPGVAAQGNPVRLRATVRGTDFVTNGTSVSVPAVSARVVGEHGAQQDLRLWPTAALGVFEAEVPARAAGRYDVRVETADGVSADTPLIVTAANGAGPGADPELAAMIAASTGGAAVTADNLQPLIDRLRALPHDTIVSARHPFRSPWWGVAFAGLLTAEWTLRRRRGLR